MNALGVTFSQVFVKSTNKLCVFYAICYIIPVRLRFKLTKKKYRFKMSLMSALNKNKAVLSKSNNIV